jgi:adenosylcobinamide-GDP ribazoletransferase
MSEPEQVTVVVDEVSGDKVATIQEDTLSADDVVGSAREVTPPAIETPTTQTYAWSPPVEPKPQGFKSALSLLTIYPAKFRNLSRFSYRTSVAWFGWIGVPVALPAFFIVMFLQWTLSPLTLALAVLVVSAVVTRMMHWDGLADVADAWWGGQTTQRRQEIMSDTATGSFALITLIMVFAGLLLSITDTINTKHFLALLIVPMLARIAVVYAVHLIAPAKPTGLASSVGGTLSPSGITTVIGSIVFAIILSVITSGTTGILAAGLTMLAGFLVARITSRRMGGLTGDVLGTTIVLTELLGYCMFLLLG